MATAYQQSVSYALLILAALLTNGSLKHRHDVATAQKEVQEVSSKNKINYIRLHVPMWTCKIGRHILLLLLQLLLLLLLHK
jgi:hypothetical protein